MALITELSRLGEGSDLISKQDLLIAERIIVGSADSEPSSGGTVAVKGEQLLDSFLEMLPSENHRSIFRGKNLGNEITSNQLSTIQSGEFKDIWLGDYWVGANDIRWRIVDIDYWLGSPLDPSDSIKRLNVHHVVIMPDCCIDTGAHGQPGYTRPAYKDSLIRSKLNGWFAGGLPSDNSLFNGRIISHLERFGGDYVESAIEAPSEIMMYGCNIFGQKNNTVSNTQLALFKVAPKFIRNGGYYIETSSAPAKCSQALRDVSSANGYYAVVSRLGEASEIEHNVNVGIRPVFAVGLQNN